MNNFVSAPPVAPTSIATTPRQLSESEKQRVLAVAADIERLEGMLPAARNLKATIAKAGEAFAAGELSLEAAIGIHFADTSLVVRHDIERRLCHSLKEAIRQALASVDDLLSADHTHRTEQIGSAASAAERAEREQLKVLGMDQDKYEPSILVQGLREQFRRMRLPNGGGTNRTTFNQLVASL